MRTRKETAIEKWNATELPRSRGARTNSGVECAEEKRLENPSLIASPDFHASRVTAGEKREVAVQPSLGLEERQEDQARDVQQSELASLLPLGATGKRVAELEHHPLECAKESVRDRFAAEDIEPAGVGQQIGFAADRGEGAQRFGVALHDVVAAADERKIGRASCR